MHRLLGALLGQEQGRRAVEMIEINTTDFTLGVPNE